MPVRKIIKIIWISFASLVGVLVLFILAVRINLFGLYGELPPLELLENPKSEVATEIYSADGEILGKYYSEFNRTPVEYKQLPQVLIDALMATEDIRFEDHSGVDAKGVFAIVPSLLMGKRRGSSTITQQLAKNLLRLREEEQYQGFFNGSVVTKVKEWMVAIQLERAYTKKEILLMYLNTVEFSNNSFGIKAATRKHFDKPVEKLQLHEAALLVGMLQNPTTHNPRTHKEAALTRRNTVLAQMEKYGKITRGKLDTVSKYDLKLNYNFNEDATGLAAYFRNYLRSNELRKWCRENGKNLNEDGLKIYTTIDSRMQRYAEEAMKRHMSFLQKEFFNHWGRTEPWKAEKPDLIDDLARKSNRYKEFLKIAGTEKEAMSSMKKPIRMRVFSWNGSKDTLMSPYDSIAYKMKFLHTGFFSMDPHTGYVKAWVGDIDYRYFQYDHVKQSARQPGSTFKPILYACAMQLEGLTPESKVLDHEVAYATPGGKVWTPKNSNGNYSNEYYTLRQALGKSINSVSAYLIDKVTPDSLVSFAREMGITSPLDPVPPLCLGTSDVNLFEMVNVYSVFANKGIWIKPQMITRIEDKHGNILAEFRPESKQVITEQTANYMLDILQGSVEESGGTSTALKSVYHLPGDIGGKTGTTQNSADGWFLGITPDLVSGVWVGGEDRSIHFRTMQYGQGAKMALPIWGDYMQRVYNDSEFYHLEKRFDIPKRPVPSDDDAPADPNG